jgi:hypothetical protein
MARHERPLKGVRPWNLRNFLALGLPLLTGLACLTGYFLLRRRLRYTLR